MRYSGQGWEIPVALTPEQAMNPDVRVFQSLFEADYEKLFGRVVSGMDVEITVWAVNATTPPQKVIRLVERKMESRVQCSAQRQIFDPALGHSVDASIVEREKIKAGQGLVGPAVITEDETTIIVPSSRKIVRQDDGCIDMILKA